MPLFYFTHFYIIVFCKYCHHCCSIRIAGTIIILLYIVAVVYVYTFSLFLYILIFFFRFHHCFVLIVASVSYLCIHCRRCF
jgi:hypothetical protein